MPFIVFYGSLQPSTNSTCLPAGEGKNDDVIKGPGVVLVWGVESQLGGGLFSEVNQEGGVDHGDGEAAHPLPLSNLKVVRCPLIEALEDSKRTD